jgi:large subunit ribosomal protein L28
MSRQCEITGKCTVTGCNVSHANNHTKRVFRVNFQIQRFWVPCLKKFIKLRVSAQAIRLIDRFGIEYVLKKYKPHYLFKKV